MIRSLFSFEKNYVRVFLFFIIIFILFIRCHNAILYPILHCEDGVKMFAYYMNNHNFSNLFKFHGGYVTLLPNTISFFSVNLPPVVYTYLTTIITVSFQGFMFMLFSLKRYRFIVEQDSLRFIICLLLVMFPLGNYALNTSLQYSMWNILIIATLLVIAPVPRVNFMFFLQYIFVLFAVFTIPVSVIFIPICLALIVIRKKLRDRVVNTSIIIAVIIYFLTGVDFSSTNIDVNMISSTIATVNFVIKRVIFESTFGNHLRLVLHKEPMYMYVGSLFVFLYLIAIAYVNKIYFEQKYIFYILALSFISIFAITFMAIYRHLNLHVDIYSHLGQRYVYFQQIIFLFNLILCTVYSIYHIHKKIPWLSKVAILLSFIAYISVLNNKNIAFFKTSKKQGIETLNFLSRIPDFKKGEHRFKRACGDIVIKK